MQKKLVITLMGQDHIGIVDHVTDIIVKYHGNIEESKMARLGGEFAMLLLIAIDPTKLEILESAISNLQDEGYKILYKETSPEKAEKFEGWVPYKITVTGADHEGIVNNVTHQIAEQGINIESIDTQTSSAPMSGTQLFTMNAIILVPPERSYHSWADNLDEVADSLNVTIDISPYRG
ncbi:MAG TPA: ACT domain-containing protein [bacterium]|nr:ACT domain-containing protein [bacterium]